MTDTPPTTLAGEHVIEFARTKGDQLLDVLGERPVPGATWHAHSHGAFLAVESPYPDLFDRLAVVLPRPEDRAPDAFREWSQQRLDRLDRYMEATNTGKLVRVLPLEQSVAAVIMRRSGRDPAEPGTDGPPILAIPRLLARFAEDVERYARFMGDPDLRYVRALRLHRIQPKGKPPEWHLGLDALNTAIGLRQPPLELGPLDLVRGILAEMGEQVEHRLAEDAATRSPRRPLDYLAAVHRGRRRQAVLAGLDDTLGWIDVEGPTLDNVAARLRHIEAPVITAAIVVPVVGALFVAGVAALLILR